MEKICKACEIESNDEQVKQMPLHTCGKDGPIDGVGALKTKKEPVNEKEIKSYLNYEDVQKELETAKAELTRLRSELQQAKQEIANHIAVNSLLTDSDGEADLANKLYKATSELQQKDEVIKDFKKLHNEMLERVIEYEDGITDFGKGKAQAYRFAAKKMNDLLVWHDLKSKAK